MIISIQEEKKCPLCKRILAINGFRGGYCRDCAVKYSRERSKRKNLERENISAPPLPVGNFPCDDLAQSVYNAISRMATGSSGEGYIRIYYPECPYASSSGQVLRTHLLAWKLGYSIPCNTIIHHKDENRTNDNPTNLFVTTREEHNLIHKVGKTRSTPRQTYDLGAVKCSKCGKEGVNSRTHTQWGHI